MENLTKLHDSVHNGSFIPETLNQKMTDGLRSISQLQTEIFQEYASLEIGDLPDYIEEMETVLSEYQKKLEEQERYQEAVRFFFSLHSDNKEIENPSLVCHKEQPELLTKKDSPKAKDKFGVSRFKGDMKKQLCLHKLDCLIEAVNGSIYTKESMSINHNQQEGFFDLATDKLYQMGYLTRYYVNGMEEFYTLSSRGEKAFSTKESFSFIKDLTPGLESNPLSGREEIEDTTNAAISRILLSDCYKKIILIDPSYTFSKRKLFVLNDAFILTLPLVKDELTVFFVGIVTERIDTFRDIRTNIKKISEAYTPDFLIVIEPDRDMASNIADWIETFSSITTTVGYCVYHEDDMFDITGGSSGSPFLRRSIYGRRDE